MALFRHASCLSRPLWERNFMKLVLNRIHRFNIDQVLVTRRYQVMNLYTFQFLLSVTWQPWDFGNLRNKQHDPKYFIGTMTLLSTMQNTIINQLTSTCEDISRSSFLCCNWRFLKAKFVKQLHMKTSSDINQNTKGLLKKKKKNQ